MAILLFGTPLAAEAQQTGKVWRIGVLSPGEPPAGPSPLDGFRQGLGELGYIEGQNVTLEWQFGKSNEKLRDAAGELIRLKVDVIFAINTQAAQAAKSATKTVPIVIARVADPVRTGLVSSIARPGGNVTGLSAITDELSGKRLELLKEALPGVLRVALLWNAGNPGVALVAREFAVASHQVGLQLQSLAVRGPDDFRGAFEVANRGRAGAVLVIDDVLITSHRRQILDWALKSRLPVICLYREFAEAGSLMAYGPSISDMYHRAAHFVDKILRGAKPGDLPIEQPTKFELIINLRAAKALGLTIPPALLLRANELIQ